VGEGLQEKNRGASENLREFQLVEDLQPVVLSLSTEDLPIAPGGRKRIPLEIGGLTLEKWNRGMTNFWERQSLLSSKKLEGGIWAFGGGGQSRESYPWVKELKPQQPRGGNRRNP